MGKTTGGPAFPVMHKNVTGSFDGICGSLQEVQMDGMTLRDYFAAKALNGIISNDSLWSRGVCESELQKKPLANLAAEYAYTIADAMLAERNK